MIRGTTVPHAGNITMSEAQGPDDLSAAPSLLVKALRQFTTLMQDEIALARAELSRSLSKAGVGLALIGAAAILALVSLNVLASALVAYLAASGIGLGTAALIVGGALLLAALILAFVGKSRLGADALVPSRTAKNLQTDFDTLKEATNG